MIPASRPQRSEAEVRAIIAKRGVTASVVLVGYRGYYSTTFGKPGNDRAVYDDAIFLVAPEFFASYNANVDPSAFREGIANLVEGVHLYKLGIHGLSKPKHLQYEALVQAAKVTVNRDKKGKDTGMFGINIHRGGYRGTSSLGCQTIPPAQWDSFIASVKDQMKRNLQKTIPYILVNEADLASDAGTTT